MTECSVGRRQGRSLSLAFCGVYRGRSHVNPANTMDLAQLGFTPRSSRLCHRIAGHRRAGDILRSVGRVIMRVILMKRFTTPITPGSSIRRQRPGVWSTTVLAYLVLMLVGGSSPAAAAAAPATSPVGPRVPTPAVRIGIGSLRGLVVGEKQDVYAYKGIPYAAPPVGDLRW